MTILTESRLELLRLRLAAISTTDSSHTETVVAQPDTETGRFGAAERRMWRIYELDPDSVSHNIGLVLDFTAGYRPEAVIASFELMVHHAEVLGSTVTLDDGGVPRRVPHRSSGRWAEPTTLWEWGVPISDADKLPVGRSRPEIHAAATILTRAPFRLTQEPPLRTRVYAHPTGEVTMILVVHHLAVDDTSWPPLLGTLVSGTWSEPAVGRRVPVPDHESTLARAVAHAQRTWAAEDIRFPLSGSLPEISAADSWLSPMDDRPGARLVRPLDPGRLAALDAIARDEMGATVNAVYIAVCALGVYALTGAADHVLLVPADNRRPGDGPRRVGYSGNIVPLRFTIDPQMSVKDALHQAVSVIYHSMEFANVDYGAILTALRAAGGRFPVAEIMASVRNAPLRGIPVPSGAQVGYESVSTGIGNYPLTIAFEIGADDRIHLEIDYQTAVVTTDFAEHAADLIAALITNLPAALDGDVAALVRAARGPESA